MFKQTNNNVVYVSEKTKFHGTVESKHDIYIMGEIKGNINTKKNIYILKGAKVYCDLNAINIQIFGLVEGNVSAERKIIISEDARVFGTVKCKSLKLSEGAIYSGDMKVEQMNSSKT